MASSSSRPSRWTARRRARAVVDAELEELDEYFHHGDDQVENSSELDHGLDLVLNDGSEHDRTESPQSPDPHTESETEACSSIALDLPSSDNDEEAIVEGVDLHAFNQEEFDLEVDQIDDTDDIDHVDSDSNEDFGTLEDRLCRWANDFQNQVSHAALAGLLSALRPDFPHLPKDPRTLLSTGVKEKVIKLAGGEYYHFGLKECILAKLDAYNVDSESLPEVVIDINIDGLPLFKSSSGQVWPILGMINSLPEKDPFVIGIFYGLSKPKDVKEYLSLFIQDVCSLRDTGMNYCGMNIPVHISAVICDAPARAFIKLIKGHSGYYSCERCTQRGEYCESKVTFPSVDSPLRTDALFADQAYEHHQTGRSPLLDIPVNLVSQFPLDYMHLICLGVTRRLIMLWKKGPFKCRIGPRASNDISERLLSLRGFIPREFARKPRSLTELDRWKATEYRQFLLYTGPAVLLNILPDEMYKNFLLLSVAVQIMLSPSLCEPVLLGQAKVLLVSFVRHYQELYGQENVVYNIHSVIHLPDDALQYGPLDNVSSFPFENFLGKLKKLLRKPSQPLQQIVRRISEKGHVRLGHKEVERLKGVHRDGPVPHELRGSDQYQELNCKYGCIRTSHGDNCVSIHEQVAIVKNIVVCDGTEYVVYSRFRRRDNHFVYPFPSQEINISRVSDLHWEIEFAPVAEIRGKFVLLPLSVLGENRQARAYMVAPLLHTQ